MPHLPIPANAQAHNQASIDRHFGGRADLVPLWIAEPYVDLAPPVIDALAERSTDPWYGYETRPEAMIDTFWEWHERRNSWDGTGLETSVSPSIGTSLGVLIEEHTDPGDGVILQPPVFTDFKPIIARLGRRIIKNSLVETGRKYSMDLSGLAEAASDPTTKLMILCNPHNPVGRVWTPDELSAVVRICADNDVFVVADEIHADITLGDNLFTPIAKACEGTGLRWAATHGPIKTFGLAGVCDTLLISDDEPTSEAFRKRSSQLHLNRNNVFNLAAFNAAYTDGGDWLDGFLRLIAANAKLLEETLPEPLGVARVEGTYLAWLDLRGLGLDVPELTEWLSATAGLALSPGHWFGREGAGFARMTIAAPPDTIEEAINRLTRAING